MALPLAGYSFVGQAPDAELEDALVEGAPVARAAPRSSKRWLATGGVVLGLLATVALLHLYSSASTTDIADVSESIDASLVPVKGQGFLFHGVLLHEPFKQCDGTGFKNSSCCFKGCACIRQSDFYSQCETPLGSKVCNLEKAKIQAGECKSRHENKISISKAADHRVEYAEKLVANKHKSHEDAAIALKKPLNEFHEKTTAMKTIVSEASAEHAGEKKEIDDWAANLEHDARIKYDKVKDEEMAKEHKYEKVAKSKRATADRIADESKKKSKQHEDVQKELDEFAKGAKARDALPTVPSINNDCTGPKVCALGCKCVFKNDYYAQCAGIHGAGFCNWKPAAARNKKLLEELPTIKEDDKNLKSQTKKTEKIAQRAEKEYAEVKKVSDGKIAAAKEIYDTTTAPTQKKTKEKLDAAQEKFDKKTSASKKATAEAKEKMIQAVLKVKKEAHQLAMAEAHLEMKKKAAKHAKQEIGKSAQSSKAWGLAAEARRCLKGEDDNWR